MTAKKEKQVVNIFPQKNAVGDPDLPSQMTGLFIRLFKLIDSLY